MPEHSPCSDCLVRNRALCQVLDAPALQQFAASGRRERLPRGRTLTWQGDEDGVCATLTRGALKLSVVDADGSERVTGLAFPADFVGTPFPGAATMQISALTDCDICVFPRRAFARALNENRKLETELLRRTLGALDEARLSQTRSGSAPARVRLAALLLHLLGRGAAGCAANPDPNRLELPLSRGEIGQLLDLRIETISRELGALEADGIIARDGRRGLRILDRSGLQAAANAAGGGR